MFDNNLISRFTEDWGWEWSSRFESCYEWLVFAAVTSGFYLFTLKFPADAPARFTIRHLFLILTVASVVALLVSVELRDYRLQQAFAKEVERHGDSFCFKYSSAMFSGYWHKRIIVLLGISCSALGVALALFRKLGSAR